MHPCSIAFQYLYELDNGQNCFYQSHSEESVSNTKITDLVFADDAVIFVELLEVLVMVLEALHEEAKPLRLHVSWP